MTGPALISILCPTRGRADQFYRMAASAWTHADQRDHLQMVMWVDIDDPTLDDYAGMIHKPGVVVRAGLRQTLSRCWNECAEHADGEILMHAGDDLLFRTPGWDTIVRDEFNRWPDRIVFVHGDDGGDHDQTFGTHGFVHRTWVETVGYLVPPHFDSDMNDVWLNEVADALGRNVKVDVLTEHMHPLWGKGELDRTHVERMERHALQRPDLVYLGLADLRDRDIARLRARMTVAA